MMTSPDAAAELDWVSPVATCVEERMREFLEAELAFWSEHNQHVAAPIQALARLVTSGGKRLRPTFTYWAFLGAGGRPDDPLVTDAAIALEFVHTFALIHDDVMDNAATRRGLRTMHLEFAGRHEGRGWRGEARRFGEGVAILVGDLAFAYADAFMTRAPTQALEVFAQLRVELSIGQYVDLVSTAEGTLDERVAEWIALHKSGKYTVERPLHLGAALAGRLDELRRPFSAYGRPLGEAFQLRDDLLDVFGDSLVTGKPVGSDLREGKLTPLLAIANRRCAGHAKRLLGRVGTPDLDDDDIAALQAVLVECGAKAEVERRIDRLVEQAVAAIGRAPVTGQCRAALTDLATDATQRDL